MKKLMYLYFLLFACILAGCGNSDDVLKKEEVDDYQSGSSYISELYNGHPSLVPESFTYDINYDGINDKIGVKVNEITDIAVG